MSVPRYLENQRCIIGSLAQPLAAAIEAAFLEAGAEVKIVGRESNAADLLAAGPDATLPGFSGNRPPTLWVQGLSANPQDCMTELTLETFRSSNESNLEAVFLGTKAAFAAMTDGGTIVNVFASSGRSVRPEGTALAAASAGLKTHTRASAIEGAGRDPQIRANGLALSRALWESGPSISDLRSAAASAVFLASEAAAYCTGSTLVHETSGTAAV